MSETFIPRLETNIVRGRHIALLQLGIKPVSSTFAGYCSIDDAFFQAIVHVISPYPYGRQLIRNNAARSHVAPTL